MNDEATVTTTAAPEFPEHYEVEVPDSEVDAYIDRISLEPGVRVVDDAPPAPKRPVYRNMGEKRRVRQMREEGLWINVPSLGPGSDILMGDARDAVRRLPSVERKMRARDPHRLLAKGRDGKLPELSHSERENVFAIACFKTAVLDWRGPGFADESGPLEFNLENFIEFTLDDDFGADFSEILSSVNQSALEALRGNS